MRRTDETRSTIQCSHQTINKKKGLRLTEGPLEAELDCEQYLSEEYAKLRKVPGGGDLKRAQREKNGEICYDRNKTLHVEKELKPFIRARAEKVKALSLRAFTFSESKHPIVFAMFLYYYV